MTSQTIIMTQNHKRHGRHPLRGGGLLLLLLLWHVADSAPVVVTPTKSLFPTTTTPDNASSSSSSSSSSGAPAPPQPPSSGPMNNIDDTQCNIEELEQANDSQLFEILQELVLRTEFFQHFAVDLDQTCPLSAAPDDDPTKDDEEDEFVCTGGSEDTDFGFEEEEPHEPACSVDTTTSGETTSQADPFGSSSSSSTTSSSSSPATQQSQALYDLSQQGFQSKEQAGAFQWKQQTDLVQNNPTKSSSSSSSSSSQQHKALQQETLLSSSSTEQDSDCADHLDYADDAAAHHNNVWLPEAFWMDLCSHIVSRGDKTKIVNLALNPERNTGYNGTHLWNAIYQENCIGNWNAASSGSDATNVFPDDNQHVEEPQCFEERVLYRLLSGLHTSTTLSIAKHYYMPSKRKGRLTWEPNPQFFMDHFQHHPEYIRNLHFSYVVLLRALKKATPFLYHYEIKTGNIVQDEAATILLKRLLDSSILQSCSSVFGAFDETLMFRQQTQHEATTVGSDHSGVESIALQQSFKGVFHNISSILDCVQCQQCKLHGKMAMLGYGTALKILFIKPSALQLERNEIVAFINTVAKLSQSIREVREMTHLYWIQEQQKKVGDSSTSSTPDPPTQLPGMATTWDSWDSVDGAVGAVAALQRQGLITAEQEASLVLVAMDKKDPSLLILAKHYFSGDANTDLIKLRDMLAAKGLLDGSTAVAMGGDPLDNPDAIVVGSGLAGLAAALEILDRGGYVVLLEKEHLLGGNSNKASSGINACCPNATFSASALDSEEIFLNDTIKSAGTAARPDLIEVLVSNSANAVEWLKSRAGVDLSLKAQLGGHSSKRTHRPSNGMAGAEIIYGMQKAVRKYEKTGHLRVIVDTKVTELLTKPAISDESTSEAISDKIVVGVEIESTKTPGTRQKLTAPFVIMATGGFASDRRPTESYLSQYRPELLQFPTTAGAFSTGDGIALTTSLGAGTTSMDQVQIHPTGWVDPTDPDNKSKTLAAELMRGVGGILLNDKGQRFGNELGTRAYVTDKMLSHNWRYYMTKKWEPSAEIPTFALILSSAAAEDAGKHVDLYCHKGLLKRLEGVDALAEWAGLPVKTVQASIEKYRADGKKGIDDFGKKEFRGMFAEDLSEEVFYAGRVVPVLHYCMGGITIDAEGQVLDTDKRVILGLRAAGEVTGGVHGNNRLAGNSLLECTVFGSLVGRNLPLVKRDPSLQNRAQTIQAAPTQKKDRKVPMSELATHNTDDDCWVAIHGVVYDLTAFAEEHPAGPESILELAGRDGTDAFKAVHNENILEDFDEDRIGVLVLDADIDTGSSTGNASAKGDEEEDEDEEDCSKCQVEGVEAPMFT